MWPPQEFILFFFVLAACAVYALRAEHENTSIKRNTFTVLRQCRPFVLLKAFPCNWCILCFGVRWQLMRNTNGNDVYESQVVRFCAQKLSHWSSTMKEAFCWALARWWRRRMRLQIHGIWAKQQQKKLLLDLFERIQNAKPELWRERNDKQTTRGNKNLLSLLIHLSLLFVWHGTAAAAAHRTCSLNRLSYRNLFI